MALPPELETFRKDTQEKLIQLGVPKSKADVIARSAATKAKRILQPYTKPTIIFDDKMVSEGRIEIRIHRTLGANKDPLEEITRYAEEHNLANEWNVYPAFGIHSAYDIYHAKPKTTASPVNKPKKKRESEILKDFGKLSEEEQQNLLRRLQGK